MTFSNLPERVFTCSMASSMAKNQPHFSFQPSRRALFSGSVFLFNGHFGERGPQGVESNKFVVCDLHNVSGTT